MKFHCSVTGWGDEALQFLQEPDLNFIILFNENAPEELADISILHTVGNLTQVPAPDDTLIIGDKYLPLRLSVRKPKRHFARWGIARLFSKVEMNRNDRAALWWKEMKHCLQLILKSVQPLKFIR